MLNGSSPNGIATQRQVSLNTVRSQIRTLLLKTETRGLPDLTRFLSNFAVKYSTIERKSSFKQIFTQQWHLRRERVLELPDGRKMAYLDMGDPTGKPVLFFHSIICGVDFTEHAIETCSRAGYRIIAPSLPGYGHSSPNPEKFKTELLKANADDFV